MKWSQEQDFLCDDPSPRKVVRKYHAAFKNDLFIGMDDTDGFMSSETEECDIYGKLDSILKSRV